MAIAPHGYTPYGTQRNNRKLIVMRNGGAVLTYTKDKIPNSTYDRGDLVSRKIIRNEPFDQANSVTNTSGVIDVGTTTAT